MQHAQWPDWLPIVCERNVNHVPWCTTRRGSSSPAPHAVLLIMREPWIVWLPAAIPLETGAAPCGRLKRKKYIITFKNKTHTRAQPAKSLARDRREALIRNAKGMRTPLQSRGPARVASEQQLRVLVLTAHLRGPCSIILMIENLGLNQLSHAGMALS